MKVDPNDRTTWGEQQVYCSAEAPGFGWVCDRPEGHDGPHQVRSAYSDVAFAVWPQEVGKA